MKSNLLEKFDIEEREYNELVELERRGPLFLASCKEITVVSDGDMAAADKMIGQGAAMSKATKAIIKPVKDKFNSVLKDVRGKEKEMLDVIAEGSDHLVNQIVMYEKIREEKIRKEIEAKQKDEKIKARIAALEMAEQGLPEEAIRSMEELGDSNIVVQVPQIKTKTTIKDDWDVEILPGEAEMIPVEYLIPVNESMRKAVAANIKKIVVARGGNVVIPGVRIHKTSRSIKRAL